MVRLDQRAIVWAKCAESAIDPQGGGGVKQDYLVSGHREHSRGAIGGLSLGKICVVGNGRVTEVSRPPPGFDPCKFFFRVTSPEQTVPELGMFLEPLRDAGL